MKQNFITVCLLSVLFSSISYAEKELHFKFLVNNKDIYYLKENEVMEIPIHYDNKDEILKVKIIKTGLNDKSNKFQFIIPNDINIKDKDKIMDFPKKWIFASGASITISPNSSNPIKYTFKTLDLNNDLMLQPALYDTNIDLLQSTITSLDNRKNRSLKLNENYSLWSNYTHKYIDKKFYNRILSTTFIVNKGLKYRISSVKNYYNYSKKSNINAFNIGIDKKISDNSTISPFLIFATENSKAFRNNLLDDKINVIRNNNGFYTADTVSTAFGIGLNYTKYFDDAYFDILTSVIKFNRDMVSHDKQNATSSATAITSSVEIGKNFKINDNFIISPQLQQIYYKYNQKEFTNSVDILMPERKKQLFTTRLGFKMSYKNIYAKINSYMDYYKKINSFDLETEIGTNKLLVFDKFNINSSISYRHSIYKSNDKAVKFNISINI